MAAPRKKLCIFVIAYQAEDTLVRVLERIPRVIFEQYACEILVVDDASTDRTWAIGREYKRAHPHIKMTVLRNELNQGYGGNQKVGYRYALLNGFDWVAMVHGDGQYAPEELPRLVEPLASGAADAVFGSRMMKRSDALAGGMPLYKWLGNQMLTTAQNALLRTRFSEFHSGYRIYSTAALRRTRFELNSNDFHFDTEIIIQLLNARARIVELPIPTYYGTEISRVNGIAYAKNVMVATLKNLFHRSGVLWQRRFEPVPDEGTPSNAHYDLKLGYSSSHQWALDAVPSGAAVVDIGCGPGGLAQQLVAKGCQVAVVDREPPATPPAGIEVHVADLDAKPKVDVKKYDYLLLLDVIEHLRAPEEFIENLRREFDFKPRTLVLTTPNIAFAVQRVLLALGQFNYGKAGILDSTHRRLFTFRSIQGLLRDSGFKIREVRGVPAPFPKVFGAGALGLGLLKANELAIKLSRTMFSYQIFIVAETTPDVDFVLQNTLSKSKAREPRKTAEPRRDAPTRARRRPTAD